MRSVVLLSTALRIMGRLATKNFSDSLQQGHLLTVGVHRWLVSAKFDEKPKKWSITSLMWMGKFTCSAGFIPEFLKTRETQTYWRHSKKRATKMFKRPEHLSSCETLSVCLNTWRVKKTQPSSFWWCLEAAPEAMAQKVHSEHEETGLFTVRVTNQWHRLCREVVDCLSLEAARSWLDVVLASLLQAALL